MNRFKLTVDFNGMVLFDPFLLNEFMGGNIEDGRNLWREFSESDRGDEVVKNGVIVPLLGINDSCYKVDVRLQEESSGWTIPAFRTNSFYPLHVRDRLVLADIAVLLDWTEGAGWHDVSVKPGIYGVEVNGFRLLKAGQVTDFGYEFVLHELEKLPDMTASFEKNMQILTLED